MSRLVRQLSAYAEYHRNGHNVATHMVGIPLILFGIGVLLSRPVMPLGEVTITPMMIVAVVAAVGYLRLDLMFGAVLAAFLALITWAGSGVAAWSTGAWLAVGLGSFVVGWTLQFVGHYFEGRKPAFVDDLSSLFVGPLFVVAEAAFMLGLRQPVRRAMEGALRPH
ncbi:Mpo1 family 2-hydroxy fatty acid dioxygenase [uncultured Sphingomonas sp.]|uniref:Mpo1 family 2-hydroxy fatty acid dioxygenase n=1 Tax=uncultured Sphingomonas sp. TaxID=158754 RepID=UPI0025DF8F9A|nr:Mpo1-like protein [uncultured Sphingomonas sp.]